MITNIHIERLVLEGILLPYHQQALMQEALQAELARLLVQGGISPDLLGGGAVPSVQAGALTLTDGAQPADLGRQIARSLYGGLGNPAAGGDVDG